MPPANRRGSSSSSTVSVFGLGKLGLPFAVSLASRNFRVVAFDIRKEVLNQLARGRAPGAEAPVETLLERAMPRISIAENEEAAVFSSRVSFVIVATPSGPDGGFSTRYVEDAMTAIGKALRKKRDFHLVVLVSTVEPGTCDSIVRPLLERFSGKSCGVDFGLCYNPEFIALGEVVRGLLRPDLVLIGQSDSKSGDMLGRICKRFCENDPPIERMSLWNAELAKISLNVYVTMKIAFANNLAAICEQIPGGDVDKITHALGLDSRVGSAYLRGGLGYGGPCFPRDNRAFSHTAMRFGGNTSFSVATEGSNTENDSRITKKIVGILRGVDDPRVALLGLTYKPNTNVVEESAAMKIARALVDRGIRVGVYDPVALSEAKKVLGSKVLYFNSVEDCLSGTDLCVIATPWKEFRNLQLSSLVAKMRRPAVLDCWRILDKTKLASKQGLSYSAIGVADSSEEHRSSSLPLTKHRRIESLVT